MRFLTWANDPSDPRCELLFASAKHFGIEVEPIGVGKEYRGGVSKIEWLADWLESNITDIRELMLCTDAYDCLYLRDPLEIKYDDEWHVTYSAERWYRGDRPPELQEHFDKHATSLYRYPNGGSFLGCYQSVCDLFSLMNQHQNDVSSIVHPRISGHMKEQWFLTHAAAGTNLVVLDDHCKFFYCSGGEWRRFACEVVDGRFRNKRTGTFPYVLHVPMSQSDRSKKIRERIAKELGII